MSPVNIDQELVTSIVDPAQHPDAPQVFYKVITGNGRSVNELLLTLPEDMPVLLLWCVWVVAWTTCSIVECCAQGDA